MNDSKNIYTNKILLIIFILLISACRQAESEEEKETTQTVEPGAIQITQSQIDAVGIKLGSVEEKNLKSIVKASGQLDVPPQNKAEVTLLMGGVVSEIFVLEGSYISKGQKLASIENNGLIQLQQEYITALSNMAYAQKEFQRQRELNENNAGTGKIFQQSETTLGINRAKVEALARQLEQVGINPANVATGKLTSKIPVYAPIGGTIGKINIETGSYAEPARSLMNIVDNSKVHCDLLVYEKDLFKVKAGQKVSFTLTNQNNMEITGKIYGVNQSFENDSKAIIAHAIIENVEKSNLIQGMYVSASIDVGKQLSTAVPTESIIKFGGKEYIFFLKKISGDKPEERVYYFDKAEVISGITDLGYTEIKLITPLNSSVKIATQGAFYIYSSAAAGGED